MIRSDRRDRWALLTGLAGTVALAWVYLILRAGRMGAMSSGSEDHVGVVQEMMRISGWMPTDYVLTLLMWAVMMIAMMVPSATPMTLLYAAVARKAQNQSDPVPRTFVFVAGYVAVWTTFSLAATTVQMLLERGRCCRRP